MDKEYRYFDKIDVEYKYFDKIDVNYIRKHQQEFINKEEYYTFIKPKVDKYKDSGLNDIDKGPVNYKGIYEREIVYNIALKTVHLLSYCSKEGDFEQFKKILK